jgi:hypothetical protein
MPNPQFCMSLLYKILANGRPPTDSFDSNEFHFLPVLFPCADFCLFWGLFFLLPILRLFFDSNTPALQQVSGNYSKRRICTGRIFAAARAGTIVAAMLMANAAAAIHTESSALA